MLALKRHLDEDQSQHSPSHSLWLCYIRENDQWALSQSKNFKESIDLGFRWRNRIKAQHVMRKVENLKFASDEMFAEVKQCNEKYRRTTLNAETANSGDNLVETTNVIPFRYHLEDLAL